jgi:hypothetical protein
MAFSSTGTTLGYSLPTSYTPSTSSKPAMPRASDGRVCCVPVLLQLDDEPAYDTTSQSPSSRSADCREAVAFSFSCRFVLTCSCTSAYGRHGEGSTQVYLSDCSLTFATKFHALHVGRGGPSNNPAYVRFLCSPPDGAGEKTKACTRPQGLKARYSQLLKNAPSLLLPSFTSRRPAPSGCPGRCYISSPVAGPAFATAHHHLLPHPQFPLFLPLSV